jgi:hypothetical protein
MINRAASLCVCVAGVGCVVGLAPACIVVASLWGCGCVVAERHVWLQWHLRASLCLLYGGMRLLSGMCICIAACASQQTGGWQGWGCAGVGRRARGNEEAYCFPHVPFMAFADMWLHVPFLLLHLLLQATLRTASTSTVMVPCLA